MSHELLWVKDNSYNWMTPGGDPLWRCPICGGGQHVYGVENADQPKEKCRDCGVEIDDYNWSSNRDFIGG